jgi:hypothetical protein
VLGGVECAALRVVCRARRGMHHADVLWAATWVSVLVREVRKPQGRLCCIGWSHLFKRVSLGRAGQYWVGSGCPGLPKRAPLVGPGSSQLTSMQVRGWC